jgi:hypothetical protein
VKPTDSHPTSAVSIPLTCDVLAAGSVCVAPDQVASLRQRPGPGLGETLPVNFLKNTDEQTVAVLAAVLQTIQRAGLTETDFRRWGIVAAPVFLGRSMLAAAVQRYSEEGAWGISPHLIPHRSQHAVSGTLSQALKIHGPNFGTGGGPRGVAEALLAGPMLRQAERLPGVWVALSGWDPELLPDRNGKPATASRCRAVVLALVAARPDWEGLRLHVFPRPQKNSTRKQAGQAMPTLAALEASLLTPTAGDSARAPALWSLPDGGWIELGLARSGAGLPAPKGTQWWGRGKRQTGAGTESKR